MSFLLDTHAVLFSAFGSPKLGARAKKIILDPENEILVSVITFWEISLKHSLGKIDLHNIGPDGIPAACTEMGFIHLDLTPEDAASFHLLPRTPHRDPFDRMLIWQAIRRNHVLISRDAAFPAYRNMGLRTIW